MTVQDRQNTAGANACCPLRVDVGAVMRQRAPWLWRLTPGWALRRLRRLICEDGLNDILRVTYPARDAAFCRGVMRYLDAALEVRNPQAMPPAHRPRVIIVCNHPLGALDGIAMIDLWTRHYGRPVRFVVNDLLMAVEPLRDTFLPVNKLGAQSRQDVRALDEAMAGDDPVIVFPAGLCSRMDGQGRVADLPWHKMFVQKARQHGRDVVPAYFHGRNSERFYRLARRRRRWRIPFNLEMALLPAEVFGQRHARLGLTVGAPIPHTALTGRPAQRAADDIRRTVYSLNHNESENH